MTDLGHFFGLAIVIDDELRDPGANPESEIVQIVKSIRAKGGQVSEHFALPQAGFRFENFGGASFFILDWNLKTPGMELGIEIPRSVRKQQMKERVEFLKELKKHRLAPVFIFTSENVEHVENALKKEEELYGSDEEPHIFVKSKSEVLAEGVYEVLNGWLSKNPAALFLKNWERSYDEARNKLFVDFYNKSVNWPVILWKNFRDDGVPPSDELAKLVSRNLLSRMVPFHVDMEPFERALQETEKNDPEKYKKTLLKVLEGERFVRAEQLHGDSIAPGDVFVDGAKIYINIRPDCDCVARDGQGIELYLLAGKRLGPKETLDRLSNRWAEREDEVAIFAMVDGHSYTFKMQELIIRKWSDIREARKGRLLAPFLTRVQQRYSSYLQRPGLPKVPKIFEPPASSPPVEVPASMSATATLGRGGATQIEVSVGRVANWQVRRLKQVSLSLTSAAGCYVAKIKDWTKSRR